MMVRYFEGDFRLGQKSIGRYEVFFHSEFCDHVNSVAVGIIYSLINIDI